MRKIFCLSAHFLFHAISKNLLLKAILRMLSDSNPTRKIYEIKSPTRPLLACYVFSYTTLNKIRQFYSHRLLIRQNMWHFHQWIMVLHFKCVCIQSMKQRNRWPFIKASWKVIIQGVMKGLLYTASLSVMRRKRKWPNLWVKLYICTLSHGDIIGQG